MVFWVLTSQILVRIDGDAHQIAAPPRAQLGAPLRQLTSHGWDRRGQGSLASPL